MKAPTCRPRFSGLFAAALWFLAPPTIMLAATEVTATEGTATEGTAPSARAERLAAMARFQKACADAGQYSPNLLVGLATSMEKILPRDMPFDLQPASEIELSLARNEKESFQIAVLPLAGALKQVSVRVGDLKSASGTVFPSAQIPCDVVGYVETKARPPYGTSHIGWWPDPILNFLGPVEVAVGDLQSFWVRVRAPKDQAPGVYRGTLTV